MTWRELKQYIDQQKKLLGDEFLDSDINVYDFVDGSEYKANVTELLFGEDEEETGWVPFITINQEEFDNENTKSEAEEASFD